MAVVEDVRPLGAELERSYQVYVGGRLKFHVKQIVYVAFSLDESVMGFAFPKEERAALVTSEPRRISTCRRRRTCASTGSRRPCCAGPGRGPRTRRRRLAHGRP